MTRLRRILPRRSDKTISNTLTGLRPLHSHIRDGSLWSTCPAPRSSYYWGFFCAWFAALLLFSILPALSISPSLPASQVSAQPTGVQLYRKSLSVDQLYSYTGRQFITSWRDDGTVSATVATVTHRPPDDDKVVYSAPQSRRGDVIVEDEDTHQAWTYYPARNIVVHEMTSAAEYPNANTQLRLLLANYHFAVDSSPGQVAGRKAYIVEVTRIDQAKPFERLWIDPFTGLILRQEKLLADGGLVSVMYFDQIDIHAKLTAADFAPSLWSARHPKTIEEGYDAEARLDPMHLPTPFVGHVTVLQTLEGYVLEGASLLHKPKSDSLHLLYSDGFYPLSLYAAVRHTSRPTLMAGSREVTITSTEHGQAVQRYSYWLVNWDTPGMTYTVAGEASLPSILRVARTQFLSTYIPPPPTHPRTIR